MRFLIVTLVLLFGLMLAGCDSAEDPPPELQGRYEGTFTYIAEPGPFFPGGEVSQPWALSLEEDTRGLITGDGSLGTVRVTVSGTHDHPAVMLEFTDAQAAYAGRFTGTLSDDGRVLDGAYTFNLFYVNLPVTLRLP